MHRDIKKPNITILEAIKTGIIIHDKDCWSKLQLRTQQVIEAYEIVHGEGTWYFNPDRVPY
ncbi:MAG: hypothetical protein ACTSP4_10590 [Candidatus Hodarchaeales archaeon]